MEFEVGDMDYAILYHLIDTLNIIAYRSYILIELFSTLV